MTIGPKNLPGPYNLVRPKNLPGLKYLMAGAVLALLAGGVAAAESSEAWIKGLREAPAASDVSYEGKSPSDFKTMTVVNRQGQQLAEVKHLLVDKNNKAMALAVDVDDSITRSREVVLRLDEASIDADKNQVVVSFDSATIKALPLWQTIP